MISFEDVSRILIEEQDSLGDKLLIEAKIGVLNAVEKLIISSNLPKSIFKKYKDFDNDENLLYLQESYRDHLFHPFHTFLVGFAVLGKLKYEGVEKSPFTNYEETLQKWLLTSLWHDITYVAQNGPGWLAGYIKNSLKFDIEATHDWAPILSDKENIRAIEVLINQFNNTNKQYEFRTWLNKQLLKYHDHAILSAIFLLREANEGKSQLLKDIAKESALAIALHNYHRSGALGKLDVKKYPLAFLLSYCDTAQEWGRTTNPDVKPLFYYKTVDISKSAIADSVEIILNCDIGRLYELSDDRDKRRLEDLLQNWKDKKKMHPYEVMDTLHHVQTEELAKFLKGITQLNKAWNHGDLKYTIEVGIFPI